MAVGDVAGGGAVCPPIVEIISGRPLVCGINCAITAKFSAIAAKFSAIAVKFSTIAVKFSAIATKFSVIGAKFSAMVFK